MLQKNQFLQVRIYFLFIALCVSPMKDAQALDRTLEQVRVEIFGVDPLHPSPSSLLGRFIAETGAATEIIRVQSSAQGSSVTPFLGPERLLVHILPSDFERYRETFELQVPLLQVLSMSNSQAEYLVYGWRFLSESNTGIALSGSAYFDSRARSYAIVLSDAESSRMEELIDVAQSSLEILRAPWNLVDDDNIRYCPVPRRVPASWDWLAHLPIGESVLDRYEFNRRAPGLVTQTDEEDPPLMPFSRHLSLEGRVKDILPKWRRVWTIPGRELFADVIGVGDSYRQGGFSTNAAFVNTMNTAVSVERLPVLFQFDLNPPEPSPTPAPSASPVPIFL